MVDITHKDHTLRTAMAQAIVEVSSRETIGAIEEDRVPKGNVIGGTSMVGQGFKTAMRVLDKGRLTMGACALGASQKLLEIRLE